MKSISDWQKKLHAIYPNENIGPDYMMAHAYTACSDLSRLLLRNENVNRREAAIISALGWLMALSSEFNIDYETALIERFPGSCPYCLKKPCQCDKTGKRAKRYDGSIIGQDEIEEERRVRYNSIRNSIRQITWKWLLDEISSIYPSNKTLLTKGGQGYVVGKLLEEGGELHRAYSGLLLHREETKDVKEELADLSAWLISCWDLSGEGYDLETEMENTFSSGCFLCKHSPCTCPPHSITKGQDDILREIVAELNALSELGFKGSDLSNAITTANAVAAVPTPETKRILLGQVKEVISNIQEAKPKSPKAAETTNNLNGMVDMLRRWVEVDRSA